MRKRSRREKNEEQVAGGDAERSGSTGRAHARGKGVVRPAERFTRRVSTCGRRLRRCLQHANVELVHPQ
jgi:hypothetical protein